MYVYVAFKIYRMTNTIYMIRAMRKKDHWSYSACEGQDQPVPLPSLILELHCLSLSQYRIADSLALMRRLIWSYTVNICLKTHFSVTLLKCELHAYATACDKTCTDS